MSQAKRIKPKPPIKSRPKKNVKARNRLPWGLLLVILTCGLALGMLISGARTSESGFGSGLRSLFEQTQMDEEVDKGIAKLIETKSSKKEFDFYELLPDTEKIMADVFFDDARPDQTQSVHDYYLQAASFKVHADAEKLRARLALKGYKSATQAKEVEGKGTYYRVRLGPYVSKRKAKATRNKLQKLGLDPFTYKVNK